jgi:hypothetical protein
VVRAGSSGLNSGCIEREKEECDPALPFDEETLHRPRLMCRLGIKDNKDWLWDIDEKPSQNSMKTFVVTLPSLIMKRRWFCALIADNR